MSTSTSTQFLAGWGKLRICLYTLISYLLIPFVLLISIPFLIFRILHQFLTKTHNKNILKILDPLAQIAAHDFFEPTPRLNIVATFFGEGTVSIETLQGHILNLIDHKDKTGKSHLPVSEYAELACRVVKLGGFFYWEKILNFDIKEYVKIYSSSLRQSDPGPGQPNGNGTNNNNNNNIKIPTTTETTESDLKKIVANLTSDPWDHGSCSPWEIFVINNYIDNRRGSESQPKSVIILRIHHHVADGYSILNFVKRLSAGNCTVSAAPNSNLKRKISPGYGLAAKLLTPLVFPYHVALMVDTVTRPRSRSWRLSPEQCQSGGENYFQSWSSPRTGVSVETVKEIKNKFGVSFQAVLNCVLGGAIHSLMKRMKQERDGAEMAAFVPVPLPGHPGGLHNYLGYLVLNLPVGDTDTTNPMERLELAAQELSALSKSPFPIIAYMVYRFSGLFPTIVTRSVTGALNIGNSIIFSPFPGLDGDYYIGGLKVSYILGTLGTSWGDAGASITSTSNQGQVRFSISIDQHLCPSQDILDEFSQFIQDEVQMLVKYANSRG